MKAKSRKIGERYRALVTRSVVVQQIVRVTYILFFAVFVWFGLMAIKQATIATYFLFDHADYSIGQITDRTHSSRGAISTVTVTYMGHYSTECIIFGTVRTIKNDDNMPNAVVMYIHDHPELATCDSSGIGIVLQYVYGVSVLAIGAVVVFVLLFRKNRPLYRQLIGMYPVPRTPNQV